MDKSLPDDLKARIRQLEEKLETIDLEYDEKIKTILANYRRVIEATSEGFFELDVDFRIIDFNATILGLIGLSGEKILHTPVEHLYDNETVFVHFASRDHLSFEATFFNQTGENIPLLFKRSILRDKDGQANGYLVFLTELTELKQAQEELRHLANHDSLTGLFNTRYLYKSLNKHIIESNESSSPFSLVFLDMDNFKHVVDTYGHLNGSQALKEAAETLKECLIEPSFGVAYGGDEFVLVLPQTDKTAALEIVQKIRRLMKATVYLTKRDLKVHMSASFGVATYPDDAVDSKGLLALADEAMFRVKTTGKDAVGLSRSSD